MKIFVACRHIPYMFMQATLLPEINFDLINEWNFSQRPIPDNVTQISLRNGLKGIRKDEYKLSIFSAQYHHFFLILYCICFGVKPILVVHAKLKRRGKHYWWYKALKYLFNRLFISPLVRMNLLTLVFIQPAIKEEYGLPGFVIEPGLIDPFKYGNWKIPDFSNGLRICIVGNDLEREHFDQGILSVLSDFKDIDIVGTSTKLQVAKPSLNYHDYLRRLSSCNVYLNLLDYPETGYNLATLEASSLGLLVLSKPSDEAVIYENYNGLVINNRESLLDALQFSTSNPVLIESIAKRNQDFFKHRFSAKLFHDKWCATFSRVLSGSVNP